MRMAISQSNKLAGCSCRHRRESERVLVVWWVTAISLSWGNTPFSWREKRAGSGAVTLDERVRQNCWISVLLEAAGTHASGCETSKTSR